MLFAVSEIFSKMLPCCVHHSSIIYNITIINAKAIDHRSWKCIGNVCNVQRCFSFKLHIMYMSSEYTGFGSHSSDLGVFHIGVMLAGGSNTDTNKTLLHNVSLSF